MATAATATRDALLMRHRERRARWLPSAWTDDQARVDPSDVVQDALADACVKLHRYLEDRPLPFYPWLRQIAWERLVKLHRRHLWADRRSVAREEGPYLPLPDESALQLAERLAGPDTTPSGRAVREELRARVWLAAKARGEVVVWDLKGADDPSLRAATGVSQYEAMDFHPDGSQIGWGSRRTINRRRGGNNLATGKAGPDVLQTRPPAPSHFGPGRDNSRWR
jgi:hypothetical protein